MNLSLLFRQTFFIQPINQHIVEGGEGGHTRVDQLGIKGYKDMDSKGGQAHAAQLGSEGHKEMAHKDGLATIDMSDGKATEAKGVDIDESNFTSTTTQL
ncbi:hypothetical protein L7F22_068975 [Adiantum nelumboides]|nr:hypothetical protein [Adiantum nelumboides]